MLRIKRILSLLWALRPWGTLKDKTSFIVKTHNLEIEIKGDLPDTHGIIVANHVSYLDPIIIGSILECIPVAKSELARWPLFGYTLKKLGLLFYKRGDILSGFKILRSIIGLLKKEKSTLIFPEGTTTDGTKILPFKRGVFGVSKLTGMPIIPIQIKFNNKQHHWWLEEDNFIKHYWWQSNQPKTKCTVIFGPMVEPHESVTADRMAELIQTLISSLK